MIKIFTLLSIITLTTFTSFSAQASASASAQEEASDRSYVRQAPSIQFSDLKPAHLEFKESTIHLGDQTWCLHWVGQQYQPITATYPEGQYDISVSLVEDIGLHSATSGPKFATYSIKAIPKDGSVIKNTFLHFHLMLPMECSGHSAAKMYDNKEFEGYDADYDTPASDSESESDSSSDDEAAQGGYVDFADLKNRLRDHRSYPLG